MVRRLRATRPWLTAIGVVTAAALVIPSFTGTPQVTRVPIVLMAALLLAVGITRPWRWSSSELDELAAWRPSRRAVWISAGIAGLVLFWIVLNRFQSGSINAVDFTVYFDRPIYQTLLGRPLFIESADDPLRAYQSCFMVHAHWILLPVSALYWIHATPLWLLALSVVAVVVGAVNVLRVVERVGGGGLLATASALAFVLNDNTARTLSYGFHVEVLYAALIPLLLNAALSGRRIMFIAVAIACVSVKEDAFLPLFGVSVALGLMRYKSMTPGDRVLYLVAPTLAGLFSLWAYYALVLPRFRPDGVPFYANYWGSFGSTPGRAFVGMLSSPWRVARLTLTSPLFTRVLVPHLFLPLAGWRWTLGVVPIAVLYGASDNQQIRAFGIYYAIVLVPFLVLGAAAGAKGVAERLWGNTTRAKLIAASAIVLGALAGGISDAGFSLRAWKSEVSGVAGVIAQLANEPVVFVQSGLYPHAGYESRVQLLTPEALADPANAGKTMLLAPSVNAWPLSREDVAALATSPAAQKSPSGLIVARIPGR